MKKRRNGLNPRDRLHMKLFICMLGLLLLVILAMGCVLGPLLRGSGEQEEAPVHIPVVEEYANVWIMEADASKVMIFRDGVEETYYYGEESQENPEKLREHIADIQLTDGCLTNVQVKEEKINARLLGADGENLELEGYGRIPLAEDYRGYRLHNSLMMCTPGDLPFGYDFADYVMEDGKICGILWAKEEAMEYIRVLLKASDYASALHDKVILTADCDFAVQYGASDNPQREEYPAGTELTMDRDSAYFAGGRVIITPNILTGKIQLLNINRSQGIPGYRGCLELVNTEAGMALINEVLLEEYLYSVVPSEMPSTYPEEALKAQAICARTYAYGHMLRAGYPQYGAHVDDSTSYQVYNNILEQETTTTAVKETYGQLLLTAEGSPAGTYYYSTSCGVGSDANVWKTEEAKTITYLRAKAISERAMRAMLQGDTQEEDAGKLLQEEETFSQFIRSVWEDDFEAQEPWYRWTYEVKEIDRKYMLEVLQKRYQANEKLVLTLEDGEYVSKPIKELGAIQALYVEHRGAGGIGDELIIQTKKHTYKVISEHNIRYVLNDGVSKVLRQDGKEVDFPTLLPSAFFVIETEEEGKNITGYKLYGGGFGHGAGMSQNGARNMAVRGYDGEQILLFFYEDCHIQGIYE